MELVKEKREKNKKRDIENKELIRKYRETGDESYREAFFDQNDKLAHHVALKFKNTGIDYEELLSCTRFGMLKAFNTFDLDKDIRFVTYADRCMSNEILMLVRNNKKHKGIGSLEAVMYRDSKDGSEITLMDMLEDRSIRGIDSYINNEAIYAIVHEIKNVLNEKELIIFNNMINEERMTQKELSESLNFSQSYVSRLESKIEKIARSVALKIGIIDNPSKSSIIGIEEPRSSKPKARKNSKGLVKMNTSSAGRSAREIVEHVLSENPDITPAELADQYGMNKSTAKTYMYQLRSLKKEKEEKENLSDIRWGDFEDTKEVDVNEIKETDAPKKQKPTAKKTDLNLLSARGSLAKNLIVSVLASLDEDQEYHVYLNIERKDPS